MKTGAMKGLDKGAIGTALLTNQVFIYTATGVGVVALLYFFLPSLWSGAGKAAGAAFNDVKGAVNTGIDTGLSSIASIIGSPQSQNPQQRVPTDTIRGVATQGDRALSDIYDGTIGRLFG
jgi:hypothetical protein